MSEIIKIENAKQIIDKMTKDGDLRVDRTLELEIFEVYDDDTLGFYQTACEFIISSYASRDLKKQNENTQLRADLEEARKELHENHYYIGNLESENAALKKRVEEFEHDRETEEK